MSNSSVLPIVMASGQSVNDELRCWYIIYILAAGKKCLETEIGKILVYGMAKNPCFRISMPAAEYRKHFGMIDVIHFSFFSFF